MMVFNLMETAHVTAVAVAEASFLRMKNVFSWHKERIFCSLVVTLVNSFCIALGESQMISLSRQHLALL